MDSRVRLPFAPPHIRQIGHLRPCDKLLYFYVESIEFNDEATFSLPCSARGADFSARHT